MVDLSSILNFKKGAQGASSTANSNGDSGNPGGNPLSGILGVGNSETKNPMSKEITAPPKLENAPTQSFGNETPLPDTLNKIDMPVRTAEDDVSEAFNSYNEHLKQNNKAETTPKADPTSKLEDGPHVPGNSKMPDKLEPIGEKPKTIVDETYQEAMARGKYTPAQWLSENAKAAKNGEREPLSIGETLEVLKNSDNLNETPDERKKRERREGIGKAFSTFGNIAANIANFAFATQGGIPGDYNNKAATEREKEIEARRQRLKEKYDDIIINAKGDEVKYARNLKAAKEKIQNDNKYKDQSHQLAVDKYENDKTRQAAIDAENKRKNDAQIKKWEADAKNGAIKANAAAKKTSSSGSKPETKKYAASFMGQKGTYRFEDQDIAYGVASSATSMLKKLASEKGDDDTVNAIMDAMAELKSAPAALAFVQQRLADYPQVEEYIANKAKEFPSNITGGKTAGFKKGDKPSGLNVESKK